MPSFEEHMQAVARNLDTLTKIHLDNDREYRERFDRLSAEIEQLKVTAQQDGENIRALARIAEIHERRLGDLEGPQS
jgi:hypothetical protein